jgi:trehalose 6-phosphate phosphatase
MKLLRNRHIPSGKRLLLLLDFDGTLTPIVRHPDAAALSPRTKAALMALRSRGAIVGIVTGRSLRDIRRRVGLRGVLYAANHGMEIFFRGRWFMRRGAAYRRPLTRIGAALRRALSGVPDILVEEKGLSVAVHLRRVPRVRHRAVRAIVADVTAPWLARHDLQLTGGKMICEVRPAKAWNKGRAALWIWRHIAPRAVPIAVGDDATDEDAFRAVRPHGLTVRIGRRRGSQAEYFLPSVRALTLVLESLAENEDG